MPQDRAQKGLDTDQVVDPVVAERRRAEQMLARADAIRLRADHSAQRAREARGRAQAAIERANNATLDRR